jgi:cephalosporin hydroxylase
MHRLIAATLNRIVGNRFHRLYYDSGIFYNTSWLGAQVLKCPFDLWIYQEIIHEIQPDVVVECGTFQGGSSLFLASVCDLVGHGSILTIDTEQRKGRPQHHRIQYLHGSSTSEKIVEAIERSVQGRDTVIVILDSDHHKEHVLNELRIYSQFVTTGSYLIVEDTNINGHPVRSDFGPGPMEAVEAFLEEDGRFVIDRTREKFILTFNPHGYLRKTRA